MFKLHTENREGVKKIFLYNPHTSEFLHEDGTNVLEVTPRIWKNPHKVSPENPGKKIHEIKTLKIQLGLACNFTCSYCLQSSSIQKASKTTTADVDIFLKNLDKWLEGRPDRIELWGGEPFLYWNKIKKLVPALREKWPDIRILIISNGTLIDDEILDQIDEWNIEFAISHDGPGYHVRGEDPLDDPEKFAMFDKIEKRLHGRMSFNAVLTPSSYNVAKVIDWFENKFGRPINVNFEGVVHDYGGNNSSFTKEQLSDLTSQLTMQLLDGSALRSFGMQEKIEGFINSIARGRPSSAFGQKCGMDREDKIAVDLLGNVMTCQNVGSESQHKIGNVQSFERISLNTAWHWSHRAECSTCPLLQLCAGACMYQEGKQWESSCNSEFAYNTAFLAAAIYLATGYLLTYIEGHMVRPGNNNG
jgi:uncharacterized protein